MTARIAFTYADYAALPDDGKRYEIVEGELCEMAAPRKRRLYARYGVEHYWLVDLEARDIEACVLRSGAYVGAARVSGDGPVDLPPFEGLALVPSALWQ